MTHIIGTTLPVKYGGGALDPDDYTSYLDITNIIFVDKGEVTGSEDGTQQNPFHTIGDALTAAAALTPAVDNQVVIFVYPGTYSESALTSVDYTHIIGFHRDTVIFECSSAARFIDIENPYTYYANFTVTSSYSNTMLSIEEDDGALNVGIRFDNCRFITQINSLVQRPQNTDGEAVFRNCLFESLNSENIFCFQCSGGTQTTFLDCQFYADVDLEGDVLMRGCLVTGQLELTGNASNPTWQIYDSRIVSSLSHAIHLYNNDYTLLEVMNCYLESDTGDWDIYTLDLTITAAQNVIEGNIMMNGIHLNVPRSNPIKRVGSPGDTDWYLEISDALEKAGTGDVILLLKDVIEATVIDPPAAAVTIDGQGIFSFGRASETNVIIDIDASAEDVTIKDVFTLDGEITLTSSTGGRLKLENVQNFNGRIDIQSGDSSTEVVIDRTNIEGNSTDNYCIRIADNDPTIDIRRSYLKGHTNAIYWDSGSTNGNLKTKHTTYMHGSLGANNPFGTNAGQNVAYLANQDAMNFDPQGAANFTNNIPAGQQMLTVDANADY